MVGGARETKRPFAGCFSCPNFQAEQVPRQPEPEPTSILCLLTLKQVQERAKETQIELDEARGSLNDLILEIEAVSVEEGRSREQSARILRQMADR